MEKIHSKLRRTDYYDFDHGLTLMNVLFKTEDGKLDRIDTYIGVEGNEFVCVGCAKDLSAPGVIFSYGEYVRFQRANKATYPAASARRGGHCHGGLQVSLHSHADGLHSGGCGVGDARSGADALRYFEYSGQRILH